mgnify:CR=1 FL=1
MATKNKVKTGKTESRHLPSSTERPESGKRIALLEKVSEQMTTRLRRVPEYSALRNSDGSTLKIQVSYGPGQKISNKTEGRAGHRVAVFFGKQKDSAGVPQWSLEIPEGYIGDVDSTLGQLALGVAVVAVRSLKKFNPSQVAKVQGPGLQVTNYPVTQKNGNAHALSSLGYVAEINWVLSGKGGAMTVKATSPEDVSYLGVKRGSLVDALRGTCDAPIFFEIKKSEAKDGEEKSAEPGSILTLDFGTAEALAAARDIFGAKSNAALGRTIMGEIQARIDTAKDEARTLRAVNG